MTTESTGRLVRRYGAELDDAIREAVRAELEERGYADVTFEGVARRARTSKPVLYRRYDSRALMVLDAWLAQVPSDPSAPGTGSLRGDLRALGGIALQRFERIGVATLRGLLAEVSPEQLPRLSAATTSWAHQALDAIFAAARKRGELGQQDLAPDVARLPIVILRNELIFGTHPSGITQERLDELIDVICLPLLTGSPARS
ncbi:TetR/AcrR family transcriptional regulator [Tessaracoccus defluvii]|uniref:TetR/AcrR family transcriptional regulator n=1 Tax=Tessaracoccus defluvii TaxID=1285901 RepID=A0A7H0H4K9_9ACTN|nr:TetR/AcrR family transcriptional regulator [Tessaracoccus defluvii]QNP55475.1 TetR/AcrR family transcriptional regulator [Tessaracoccus defluvii]